MDIKLVDAPDIDVVLNLFTYYLYDMSEYTGWPVDEYGCYPTEPQREMLEPYWQRDDHYPFLIQVDGGTAGFSMLRRFPAEPDWYDVGQFFVLRKFKQLGVGQAAFDLSVSRFPGQWITRVLTNNSGALAFWKKAIHRRANGPIQFRIEMDDDLEMHFFRYSIDAHC
ncbi:GNAT family N-acetyltransferase [Saccharospirillum salsuginis]|uniref:N-acetyltransferase domain-containing protein n=1 Tax=Saccharospirillum salsuginis TaxID=418750 RepID=A0A918K768_9GAMM|nr:GNAT family N-acetyltransferase [Saccharospirillum salsuginis]GGX52951.1 hypothetical protein GCM10007392_20540 [Saccharospirillum salsuginis]